jgi:hypothetical protein
MKQATLDRLIALKAEGQKTIYYLDIKGLDFLFRPLTFEENNVILDLEKHLDGATINDTIIRMTCLFIEHSSGLDDWLVSVKGFLPDHIAEKILKVSGFNNLETLANIVNEKRALANEVESLIEAYICAAFHTITPNMCKQMTLEEQIELLTKAEIILGKQIDFNKLLIKDPREAAYPVPEGMQSTEDILSDKNATPVNWEDIR